MVSSAGPARVPNLGLERASAGWHRRLDQRARRGQDGQREAEGDGPQHRDIVARWVGVPVVFVDWRVGTASLGER